MTTLDLASLYADMGLSVFPLPRGSKVPAKGFRWTAYRDRQPEHAELRQMFGDGETKSAIVSDPVSRNLVVRDFDEADAYQRWRDLHPDMAEILPTVTTARGYHVYARGQAARTVTTYPDGELRAGGARREQTRRPRSGQ